MNKKILLILFLAIVTMAMEAQPVGVGWEGSSAAQDIPFVDHYGQSQEYPRLNSNGHILYYAPLVHTDSVVPDLVTGQRAMLYANVVFDGWQEVLERGFEISTNSSFSTNTRVLAGAGSGAFSAEKTGLNNNTQYYVRAYARNGSGTSYGGSVPLRTPVGELVLRELNTPVVNTNSITAEAVIESNGGGTVSGTICAYQDADFTDLVSCQNISPTNNYLPRAQFTNLMPGTLYYFRAILHNDHNADTAMASTWTKTDLRLEVSMDDPFLTFPCNPDTGKWINYRVHMTGTDARRDSFRIGWQCNLNGEAVNDSAYRVLIFEPYTIRLRAYAYYDGDTIWSPEFNATGSGSARSPVKYYLCEREWLNEVTVNVTQGEATLRWETLAEEPVSADNPAVLPTGTYLLNVTDRYGCVHKKEVYFGNKFRTCALSGPPLPNESAHWDGEMWILDSVADEEGNWYAIKQLRSQCWMRQNLRARFTPSGFDLLNSSSSFMKAGYKDNVVNTAELPYEGFFYTRAAAVDTNSLYAYAVANPRRGICPQGWHIPTWEECCVMVEWSVHDYDPTMVITPAPVPSNSNIGSSTPITYMVSAICSATPPDYLNYTELSMVLRVGRADFWVSDADSSLLPMFLRCSTTSHSGLQRLSHARDAKVPVRCLRDP